MKHIELFKNGFDSTIDEKIQPENWPYVGYDMVTGEIVYTVIPEPITGPADNEIWYTTSDGSTANFNDSYCNTTLISNTYSDGLGIARFKDPIIKIWGESECWQEGEHLECYFWGFAGGTRIKTLILPNKLEIIDTYAFNYHYVGFPSSESADVEYLEEITLGNNIKILDFSPYRNSLQKTIYKGTVSDYCNIDVISSPVSYSHNLYIGDALLINLVTPSDIVELKSNAFKGCNSLNSITLHDNLQNIGISTFEACTGLTYLDLKNVQSIGIGAFKDCTGLTYLDLKNVQTIGDEAFSGCTGLTNIHIPESVISVGNNAFAVGYIQKSNFVNDSILDAADNNYWGATIYDYKSEEGLYCNNNYTIKYTGENNTTINIPEGVTVIDTNTFGNNSGSYSYLTINLPSTITTLKRVSIGGIEFITVNYNGTKEQWNAITKEEEWSAWSCAGDYDDFWNNSEFTIHCTDGDVTVDGRWWA
jgi:hypothetical protein